MTWSPLACGLITGKYSDGVPDCSRAAVKVSSLRVVNSSGFSLISPESLFNFQVLFGLKSYHLNHIIIINKSM